MGKRAVVIWRWELDQWRARADCHEFEYLPGIKGWFVMLAFLE